MAPERATLCLRPLRGSWFIEQLRGRHNARPGAAVRRLLGRWLRGEFAHQYQLFGERQLRLGIENRPPLVIR